MAAFYHRPGPAGRIQVNAATPNGPIMNFLTLQIPWANWQFGVLKIAILCVGILFGVYFTEFWKPLLPGIWGAAVVSTIWVTVIWLRAMKRASHP